MIATDAAIADMQKTKQRTKPRTPPVKQLPLGWLALVTIFYTFVGKLLFHQLNLSSSSTFNYSLMFLGVPALASLVTWSRSLILTLVKALVAAKAITRSIVLVSIYFLLFSLFANNFIFTYYILLPCYSGLALLALLWVMAVTASKLLLNFNYTHTLLILLGFSLLGLGFGALIGKIHHTEPLLRPYVYVVPFLS